MVTTRQQSKTKRAKNLQANNSSKAHRLKTDSEIISQISSLHVRLLKPNLNFIKELQAKGNLSINFLLNEIVKDFKTTKGETRLMTHFN